jgi:hypothetical protein
MMEHIIENSSQWKTIMHQAKTNICMFLATEDAVQCKAWTCNDKQGILFGFLLEYCKTEVMQWATRQTTFVSMAF